MNKLSRLTQSYQILNFLMPISFYKMIQMELAIILKNGIIVSRYLMTSNNTFEDNSKQSSDINWAEQNRLNAEWLKNNPDASYGGWVSI